jgi:hypothetical protein
MNPAFVSWYWLDHLSHFRIAASAKVNRHAAVANPQCKTNKAKVCAVS